MTHFQIYHETEFACKYKNPLHKTQYSVYDKNFDMITGKIKYNPYATYPYAMYIPVNLLKNTGNSRGKLKPQETESTRLQEL